MSDSCPRYRIKNWHKYQHFRDRKPPWIKLYNDILDDPEYHELDPLAAKYLPLVWLVASDDHGTLPCLKKLAFRLRITEKQTESILSKLSHWVEQDDIEAISDRYQDDAPEERREEEKRGEDSDITPEVMADLWNKAHDFFAETGPVKIPKVRSVTPDRRKKCLARIKDCQLDEEKWRAVLNGVHNDGWLSGNKPSESHPNWVADFDYVIDKPKNLLRILEKREAANV